MTEISLYLPYSLPTPPMARDLLRELSLPAFSMLLGRTNVTAEMLAPAEQPWPRALPHEQWLAARCGLPADAQAADSPATACAAMARLGMAPAEGDWFVLRPVHVEVARQGLLLNDPRALAIAEGDSRALLESCRPLFEETGATLLYGDACTWFLRNDAWAGMRTATADAALGDHLEPFLPAGEHARSWRRLQNEIQMTWFADPVNERRERAGQPTLNSVWLECGAKAGTTGASPFDAVCAMPAARGVAAFVAGTQVEADPAPFIVAGQKHGLLAIESLAGPAHAEDWGVWLQLMEELEARVFAPLLAALREGRVQRATLLLSHRECAREFTVTRAGLRRFWRRPSLAGLAS